MGITKTDNFTEQQLKMATWAKALGHPARLAIIRFLMQREDCMCGDIVEELPLSQSTVSQHLKELKDAGLIQGTISGVRTCYCINEAVWREAEREFGFLFQALKQKKSCC